MAGDRFVRGDSNADGAVDISDAVGILRHLFAEPFALPCMDSSDYDDSGELDISDAIGLLLWLFQSGSPPARPSPGQLPFYVSSTDCQPDSTDDILDCSVFLPCS